MTVAQSHVQRDMSPTAGRFFSAGPCSRGSLSFRGPLLVLGLLIVAPAICVLSICALFAMAHGSQGRQRARSVVFGSRCPRRPWPSLAVSDFGFAPSLRLLPCCSAFDGLGPQGLEPDEDEDVLPERGVDEVGPAMPMCRNGRNGRLAFTLTAIHCNPLGTCQFECGAMN